MSRRLISVVATFFVCSIVAFGAIQSLSVAEGQTPKDQNKKKPPVAEKGDPEDGRVATDLKQFMRKKLAASNKILEGLATEDMDLAREGARTLNKMSLSSKWRAHNDVMYRQFSSEFQRVTKDLEKAANEDNLDQAVLKWMGATMACIECHRFVRNTLVVDLEETK